jgi:ABC-type antimicrobial peptide transport system permease subunit
VIPGDTVHLALRNLREAVLRTALTALGVAIGIAALVGMVSFGVALQDQVLGTFLRSGVFDSITVTSAPLAPARARRQNPAQRLRQAVEASRQPAVRERLDDDAVAKFAALANVKEVYPDLRVPVEVTFQQQSEFAVARGVPMSAKGEGVFQHISLGHFFLTGTDDSCLLTRDFARRIHDGKAEDLLGKVIVLAYASPATAGQAESAAVPGGVNIQRTEKSFTITGIVDRQAGPGAGAGMVAPVMIPLSKAREMATYDLASPQALLRQLAEKRTYTSVTVKVRRPQDTAEVEKQITDMGFSAFSVSDLLENQRRAFLLLDVLLGLVGSIALSVASLGIVNTMVMSILERTREIGVMKAIGASDQDVRWIFLIEAALIGLMGGLFGIVLGWAVGRVINVGANYYLQSQGAPAANLFLIPWWLVAGGVSFALLVSLVAGLFPASRAARLDPIQALRHD